LLGLGNFEHIGSWTAECLPVHEAADTAVEDGAFPDLIAAPAVIASVGTSISGEPTPASDRAPAFDFKWMRRLLWFAMVSAIVFPLVYVGMSAYIDFHDRVSVATDMVTRTTRAAEEQALKIFDIDAALTSRLADALGTRSDDAIRRNEKDFHILASQIGGGYPQVASISIFGSKGALLANTRLFPVPDVSIGDRSDFQLVRDTPSDFSISGPMRSRVSDLPVFNISRGRLDGDGRFLGVVSVAMNPHYFEDFYSDLIGKDSPIHLALIRSDGAVLAWYPELPPPLDGTTIRYPFHERCAKRCSHWGSTYALSTQ
jgi:hypothetical protein